MARIHGVVLPDAKKIEYALTLLYGVGWDNSGKILDAAGVDRNKRVNVLTEDEIKKIGEFIDKNYKVEGDLREEVTGNINRKKEIGSYIGLRHLRGLPVRGQRTRSNARTKRGKRKTVGALKKEVWAKLEQTRPAPDATPAKK